MKQAYDVCVFGAGPAGTAVAIRLADLGVTALVLDRPPRNKALGGESFTGAIRQPLSILGLWENFRNAGYVASYEQRTAWGGEPWIQDTIYDPNGNRWHVNRARFDDDLREALRKRGVSVVGYETLGDLRRTGNGWRVSVDQVPEISSKFLVDATGRSSAVARRLGVRPRSYSRLVGLTALIRRNPNPQFDHAMVIEATPHGWWYAAPVPQGHVLAFFTDADLAPRALTRSMRTVPANSVFTPSETTQGWVAVGDACAAHDPLCGWGVHRALSNGILAAEAIGCYLKNSDISLLEDYGRHCRNQFKAYLVGLTKHYSYEQRWIESPFWKRRASPMTLAA